MCGNTAFAEAHKKLLQMDPLMVAMASGAAYRQEEGLFSLEYCGEPYTVHRREGTVRRDRSPDQVPYNDRTLIMQYLVYSSGLPPRGRWLSFLELPEGELHYAPFQVDALDPLARTFGNDIELFLTTAVHFKATPIRMGDAAVVLPAFPKIPLAFVLWAGDDEFPARANILFDAVSPTHLSTAALWVLGIEAARKMIERAIS